MTSYSGIRSQFPHSSIDPCKSLTWTHFLILKTTLNLRDRNNREHHCIHYLDVKGYVNSRLNLIRHKGPWGLL